MHVALAHNAHLAHNFYGDAAQKMVLVVAQRLRRRHHHALARVDAQRVEILHIADGDAVVVAVANHLIFNLFPAFQRFLDKNLRRVREGRLRKPLQFGVV